MAEPRFIRLTSAVQGESDMFINPTRIFAMYRLTAHPNETWISSSGGASHVVRESPEEIAAVIALAPSETIRTTAGGKVR